MADLAVDQPWEQRLIFVGGAPRSGTTLVQNLLDCHPEILGAPEFLHLPDLMSLRKVARRETRELERVDRAVRSLVREFLVPLWEREGARYLSEKTPENVLVFDALAELFPDSRFLFVLRDPRATVASILQVGQRARDRGLPPVSFTKSLKAATRHARACIESGLHAAAAYPSRVHIVTYEALVSDAEARTREICDFLEIAWTPAMLDPSSQLHLGQEAITRNSGELWYDAKSFGQQLQSNRLEAWREQLSTREQRAVAAEFADLPELADHGYGSLRGDARGHLRSRIGTLARSVTGAAPHFLVIGTQKGGTTSLYAHLSRHPQVVAARTKEIQYFSEHYARGSAWYREHFPILAAREPAQLFGGGRLCTGEATPYYLFHPHAPQRVRKALPDVKLVALLRNPIDRAYSHHRYHVKLGDEALDFEAAIDAEPERTEKATAELFADERRVSDAHRNWSYLARGRYAEQLERWLEHFPREQLLVLQSEAFFADPAAGYRRVVEFLGLDALDLDAYEAVNVGSYEGMDPTTRARLAESYREPNERLYALLGERWDWD